MRATSAPRFVKCGGVTTPSMRKGLDCVFTKIIYCVYTNFVKTQFTLAPWPTKQDQLDRALLFLASCPELHRHQLSVPLTRSTFESGARRSSSRRELPAADRPLIADEMGWDHQAGENPILAVALCQSEGRSGAGGGPHADAYIEAEPAAAFPGECILGFGTLEKPLPAKAFNEPFQGAPSGSPLKEPFRG